MLEVKQSLPVVEDHSEPVSLVQELVDVEVRPLKAPEVKLEAEESVESADTEALEDGPDREVVIANDYAAAIKHL